MQHQGKLCFLNKHLWPIYGPVPCLRGEKWEKYLLVASFKAPTADQAEGSRAVWWVWRRHSGHLPPTVGSWYCAGKNSYVSQNLKWKWVFSEAGSGQTDRASPPLVEFVSFIEVHLIVVGSRCRVFNEGGEIFRIFLVKGGDFSEDLPWLFVSLYGLFFGSF